jgi:hypothetical protein
MGSRITPVWIGGWQLCIPANRFSGTAKGGEIQHPATAPLTATQRDPAAIYQSVPKAGPTTSRDRETHDRVRRDHLDVLDSCPATLIRTNERLTNRWHAADGLRRTRALR